MAFAEPTGRDRGGRTENKMRVYCNCPKGRRKWLCRKALGRKAADLAKLRVIIAGPSTPQNLVSPMNPWMRVLVLLPLFCVGATAHAADEGVSQFFRQYCFQCHDAREKAGDVRLDLLSPHVDAANIELWRDVIHNLQRGEMPPEDEKQPEAKVRQDFLNTVVPAIARYEDDLASADKRMMRLSNTQIANSLQSLLHSIIDVAPYMVEDPTNKHGYSMQSEMEFSGGYFNLYLPKLEEMVESAVPDLTDNPDPPERFAFRGNEWEKQHYLARRDIIKSANKKYYKGPFWLEDEFKIPLPPKHEFRLSIKDNRPEGFFRIRVKLRNMPPTEGGKVTSQELTVFLCAGRLEPHGSPVGIITVPAKQGMQVFDFFGNVRDWPGVSTDPPEPGEERPLTKRRTLTLQNNGALPGFKLPPPANSGKRNKTPADRTQEAFLIRAGDFWVPHLKGNYRTNNLSPSGFGWGDLTDSRRANYGPPIYREAIKKVGWLQIESVEFELPFIESWPPHTTKEFLTDGKLNPAELPEKLKSFAAKAWRRPLTADNEAYLEKVMQSQLEATDNQYLALREALTTVLCDPRFLHLTNVGSTPKERNHELVSRLSYFLWDGPPDEALFKLADQDSPLTNAQLATEVDRMLADAKVDRFVENFVAQWFDFKRFEQIAIDPTYYPDWSIKLRSHLQGEPVAFFKELLQHDLSCLNIVDSDFVMVNRLMANHYGLEDVHSMGYTRVPAPEARGGALGMAAFHLAFSDGRDAHAINRGVWVRSRLLGDPVSEPPPDVPTLADQNEADIENMTLKERLQFHSRGTTCYDCHKDVDHWGIALEGYDATGAVRTHVATSRGTPGKPISSAVEIDGTPVADGAALKSYIIADHKDDFAYGFTKHMFSYALGRKLTYRDEAAVQRVQKQFEDKGYIMRDLIKVIVTSDLFAMREQ